MRVPCPIPCRMHLALLAEQPYANAADQSYYTMLQNNLIEAERMLDLVKSHAEGDGFIHVPCSTMHSLKRPPGLSKEDPMRLASNQLRERSGSRTLSFPTREGTSGRWNQLYRPSGNEKTALVGESGSGKSTCLKLLYRFYDVGSGAIKVDGKDLRDLKLDSIRKHIGVVPQDTVLFNSSIVYNLRYANLDATDADVYEAANAANIRSRILAFPDQYETKVGERGLKLSGGERQRCKYRTKISPGRL